MTEPITATPTAPPMLRKKLVSEVAEPSIERGTAFCTAMSMGTNTSPMPTPARLMSRMPMPRVSPSFHPARSTKAAVSNSIPRTRLERSPARSTSRAARTEKTSQPITTGTSTIPASVALVPVTACRKSGTNVMAPNMAMPERKPVTEAARTMGLAKRARGTTGSAARRSIRTKTTRSTAESPRRASTEGLHHEAPRPPSRSPTRSAEITRVVAPATGLGGRPARERRGDGRGEEEDREGPGVDPGSDQARDDRGHRRGDDRRLHGREEHGGDDAGDHEPAVRLAGR